MCSREIIITKKGLLHYFYFSLLLTFILNCPIRSSTENTFAQWAELTERVAADTRATWSAHQQALVRRKRDTQLLNFADPLWPAQWNLNSTQPGAASAHLNVVPVWQRGLTGDGVLLAIVDDGMQREHEDLREQYDPDASWNFVENNDNVAYAQVLSLIQPTRFALTRNVTLKKHNF